MFLALSDVHDGIGTRSRSGELWSVHARLVLPRLRAETQVHLGPNEVDGALPGLFTDLAANWRGWSGTRAWESYEGGLAFACEHDGLGHVFVRVTLREFSHGGWLVQGDLPLDAGQLEQTASDLVAFFG